MTRFHLMVVGALRVTARNAEAMPSICSSSLRRQISDHVVRQRLAPADFYSKLFVGEVRENARPHEGSEGAEPIGAGNVVFDAIANTENVARVLNLGQFRRRPIDLGER